MTTDARQSAATERYNLIIANCKAKNLDTNPNVIRDLVASQLKRKGLFRTYDAAVKWATDFVAMNYHPGLATYNQEAIK